MTDTKPKIRTVWVKALGNQRDEPIRFKPEQGDIDLTSIGEDRWIYTIIQSVDPGTNPISMLTKWLTLVPLDDYNKLLEQAELMAAALKCIETIFPFLQAEPRHYKEVIATEALTAYSKFKSDLS